MPRKRPVKSMVEEVEEEKSRPVVKGRAYPKDPSKLSADPYNVRRRLRRANADIDRDVEMLLPKPLDEWDLEELARGKCRDKNGHWTGRPGVWLTPKVQQEIKKRLIQKTFGEMSLEVGNAIKAVHKLITSTEVDYETGKPIVPPSVQLQASQYILDHIIGKSTVKVDVEQGSTLHAILAGALVNPDGTVAHPVIEGEIFYNDDADEDE